MASYTSKLNLYKANPQEDGESTFNIDTMLNENWDKIDQNAGETSGKLGDLSQLQTTDKSSLVNANNEIKNNLVAHLNNYTQLKEELTQPDTLTTPKQISPIISLPNAIDGQVSVGVGGRIINNLLGDDGDCEDLNKWSYYAVIPTIDTTKKLFGNSSFETSPHTTAPSYIYKDYDNSGTKYYFASAYTYLTSSSGKLCLGLYDRGSSSSGGIYVAANTSIVNSWQRIALKVTKTDGFRILVGRFIPGEVSDNFDGIMVNEITEDEYNNLTIDELMQKYIYISGTKSTTNTRIKSVGKNLFPLNTINSKDYSVGYDSGTDWIVNGDKGYQLLNNGIKIISTNTVNRAVRFYKTIKLNPGTTYTMRLERSAGYCTIYGVNSADYNGTSNIYKYATVYTTKSFTVIEGYEYIQFAFYLDQSASYDFLNIQLEEGSTSTSYEPYKESISYITLPEGVKGLHSLPNGVKDEVTTDGKLVKRVKEYVLKENDIEKLITAASNIDYVHISKPVDYIGLGKTTDADKTAILSGYQEKQFIDSTDNINTVDFGVLENVIVLTFAKGDYVNLAEAQQALAGTKIIYQLAEQQIYDLAVTPVTCFKDGTIYIESADDSEEYVVPEIQFEYPVNTAAVIQSNIEGINELGNTMNLKADKATYPIDATLQNGWVNTNQSVGLKYFKDGFGIVHISGDIKSGVVTPNVVIAVLPIGYRPRFSTPISATKADDASFACFQVQAGGNLIAAGITSGTFRLNGSFRAV